MRKTILTLVFTLLFVTGVNATEEVPEENLKSLGTFKITYYCCEEYKHICNSGTFPLKTSTGSVPTPKRTIAVDPKVIPYGSKVVINGLECIAEDTGGAIKGKRIDICVSGHKEALDLGVDWFEVWVIEEGEEYGFRDNRETF